MKTKKVLRLRELVLTLVLCCSIVVQAGSSGTFVTDRLDYYGTITYFDGGIPSYVHITPDDPGALWVEVSNNDPGYFAGDLTYISTYGPLDTLGDFILDGDQSSITSLNMQFSKPVGDYWTEFDIELEGNGALGQFHNGFNPARDGLFYDYDLTVKAAGVTGQAGGGYIEAMGLFNPEEGWPAMIGSFNGSFYEDYPDDPYVTFELYLKSTSAPLDVQESVFYAATPVPVPGAILLGCIGMSSITCCRRKRLLN